jgi:hypothetical protein
MKNVVWFMLPLIAIVFAASETEAQVSPQIGVGPTIGIGDDKGTGFHLTGGAAFAVPALPVGLRVEGMYQRVPEGDDDHEYVGGLLSGELGIPGMLPIQPYLVGGVGLFWHRELHDGHSHDAHTDLGLNIGVGTRFGVAGLNAFVEARVHRLLGGDDDGHGYDEHSGDTFIPVTIGVRF